MSSECVEFEKGSLWPASLMEPEEGQPPVEVDGDYILEIGTARIAGQCGKPSNIFGSIRIFMHPGVELHCAWQ